jgi:hypothetical protein
VQPDETTSRAQPAQQSPPAPDAVLDAARARFGGGAIGYAALLGAPGRNDGGGRAVAR